MNAYKILEIYIWCESVEYVIYRFNKWIDETKAILINHDINKREALRCAVRHGGLMRAVNLAELLNADEAYAQEVIDALCEDGLMYGPSEREGLYYVKETSA